MLKELHDLVDAARGVVIPVLVADEKGDSSKSEPQKVDEDDSPSNSEASSSSSSGSSESNSGEDDEEQRNDTREEQLLMTSLDEGFISLFAPNKH